MRSVGGLAVVAWVLAAPGVYGCGKPAAPGADSTAAPAPPVVADAAAPAPPVVADAAAPAPPVVADAAASAPPVEDVTAADDVASPTPVARDASATANAAAEVEPPAPEVDHCESFRKELNAESMVALRRGKFACSVTRTLDEPRVLALVAPDLPSPEGDWTGGRVAVASRGRWFVMPTFGARELSVKELAAGPGPGWFHFVMWSRWSEPGAGAVAQETLYLCRLPSEAEAAPRCAEKVVGGKFVPLLPGPDDDWVAAGEPKDWKAPWRLTSEGVVFGAVTGKYSPETERPAEGTVGLADFLSTGVDLVPE